MPHATGKRAVAAILFLIGVPLLPVVIGVIPCWAGWKVWKSAKQAEQRAELQQDHLEEQVN